MASKALSPSAGFDEWPAPPPHGNRQHGNALVGMDGAQAGRFADNGGRGLRRSLRDEMASAVHGGFLVGGGDDSERLLESARRVARGRGQRDRKKSLHVAATEAVEPRAARRERERIDVPQRFVARHGVRVPGQYQAATAVAPEAGHHVAFAGLPRQRHHFHLEPQLLQPTGQMMNNAKIALIPLRVRATHRRFGNQRCQHLFSLRNRHGRRR